MWIEFGSGGLVGAGVAAAAFLALKHRRTADKAQHDALSKQLSLAQELTQMAFWEWDLRSGGVTWMGDSKAIFGVEITSYDDFKARVHPNDLDRMVSLTVGALERSHHPGAEYRIIRPDGEIRWLTGRTKVIRDESGTPIRMIGMNMDIDERKRAMADLEVAQSEHRVIFDSAPAFIWYKDRHNRILRINKPAAAALGKAPEEIEGRSTYDLYPIDAAKYYADDLEVMNRGEAKLGIVERLSDPSGRARWMRTDKMPYRDAEGNIIGVIVFAQDITEQKQAETVTLEALESAHAANRAKSEFLANVSHEIRTPLGVILGFTEMMMVRTIDDATRISYGEKVLRNGQRLLKLIDEILDLSKVEQGKIDVELSEFSLQALLADLSSQLGRFAREKGLTFRVVSDGDIPMTIFSDSSRLRQILTNVISNAVKFTDKGGVEVEVSTLSTPGHEQLKFLVRDTGSGMSGQAAAGLFQPFFQGDPGTTRKFGGTGLGLALSRRLARALGGDVALLETQAGSGSIFQITVSAGPKGRMTPTVNYSYGDKTPDIATTDGQRSLNGLSVLLVEDNPDIQDMVRTFLRADDLKLTVSSDGRAGIDVALRLNPDLVIMDLQLPHIDGLEATRTLRSRGFTRPILAMTAHAMAGQREICLAAGFSEFVTKPLARRELLELIALLTARN